MLARRAQYVHQCAGATKGLPVAKFRGSWVSADQIAEMADPPNSAVLLDNFSVEYELKHLESYVLDDSVFLGEFGSMFPLLHSPESPFSRWPHDNTEAVEWNGKFIGGTLGAVIIEAISKAWGVSLSAVAAANDFDRGERRSNRPVWRPRDYEQNLEDREAVMSVGVAQLWVRQSGITEASHDERILRSLEGLFHSNFRSVKNGLTVDLRKLLDLLASESNAIDA